MPVGVHVATQVELAEAVGGVDPVDPGISDQGPINLGQHDVRGGVEGGGAMTEPVLELRHGDQFVDALRRVHRIGNRRQFGGQGGAALMDAQRQAGKFGCVVRVHLAQPTRFSLPVRLA